MKTKLFPLICLVLVACGSTPSSEGKQETDFYQPVSKNANSAPSPSGESQGEASGEVLLELPRLEVPRSGERMLVHEGFRISYNQSWLIPNWVAYELTKEETRGDVERTDYFDVDPTLKGRQARFADYSHTGYDRGHMAPAGDMKWSKEAMDACFYLTNICPQNHNLNKGDWNDLENACRRWARRYGRAWIVTGPIVTSREPKTIGDRHVVVPDAFFKVVLAPNGKKYEGIAFVMDNKAGNGQYMDDYCTIDEVENLTGIDFFHALPDGVEDSVESSVDIKFWERN